VETKALFATYNATHQHPLNRATHAVGIPMIVASLPVAPFDWRLGAGLFVTGWIFQIVGHAIEGKWPAFFSNPAYLVVGPLHFLKALVPARQPTAPGRFR
jgi:uncharacterized membrane protein YGL010W